ncbi:MAG: DEAD/DEAH box helicase [Methanobacterium sp.]|jgi:Fanconi anemia group M protein
MEKWIQHPLIKSQKIESRLYQQVLAAEVLKKGNSMIVAPTALGKTIIAALVAAERIKNIPSSKVLILAPSKPLAVQHEENLREFLKAPVAVLTGSINPKNRCELWENAQIISATPQTIESDLIAGRYNLKDVSLLVFDECHRGLGNYAYVFLASRYATEAQNPIILGLTASPGGDEDKINTVCENLFIKQVMVKSEDDVDVKPYFKPIEVEWIRVDLKKEQKVIKNYLETVLKIRLTGLKSLGIIRSISQVSKKDILMARSRVQNRISQSTNPPPNCLVASSILSAVFSLQHSLELLETQGIKNLYNYFQKLQQKKTKAAQGLLENEDFQKALHLTENAYKENLKHPKMDKLLKILENNLKDECRVIVFSQYRDTVNEIYNLCKENKISAVKFFGQASRDGEKGLTQKKQKEIIKAFRMGQYQVLISTSVAEEGIDIPSVDLVILYEPVPSEIRMIQRRGRTGRKNKGKMIVLITKGTRDESYYYSSIYKERKMKNQLSTKYPQGEISSKIDSNQMKFPEISKKDVINPLIYVDHREAKSGVTRELSKLNVEIETTTLLVADYQVSQELAVERKSTQDFVKSVIDKRLYKQAKELVDNFKKPLIILEGENLYACGLHPNAIRGALASLAIDFGIPIIPTRSPEDTGAMLYRLALREQKDNFKEIELRTEKKPLSQWEQQLYIIESLPNVGPVTARKLLEEFVTVKNVINASKDDLKKIDGIGEKIAQKIRDVVDSGFKSIKTTPDHELKLIYEDEES